MILIPPAVEAEQPPIKESINKNIQQGVGQRLKSAVTKPVVVKTETT